MSVAQHGCDVVTNPHHSFEKTLKNSSENVFPNKLHETRF